MRSGRRTCGRIGPEAREKTYDDEDVILPAKSPFLWNIHGDSEEGKAGQRGRWALEVLARHGMTSKFPPDFEEAEKEKSG